ncbi:hypothetical protein EMCRGX_G006395 [Ephydatia muelleri]
MLKVYRGNSASPRRCVRRCEVMLQHLRPQTTSPSATPQVEDEVLFSAVPEDKDHHYRLITLNRPKALNALNLHMIHHMTRDLRDVSSNPTYPVVVLTGAGNRAFCAGGDIRAVTEAGKVGDRLAKDFFRDEYILNHLIGTYKKPFIAVIDGITMGGGVGVSVHAPFRVATENTVFAMPETFIGLFPDVGGSYFLPRLNGKLGMFLALTGHRLKGKDVQLAGIATHFVSKEKLPHLYHDLADLCSDKLMLDPASNSHQSAVRQLLDRHHQKSSDVSDKPFSLLPYMEEINSTFDKGSVEGIMDELKSRGTQWTLAQYETLKKMSPTSLKVTHRQLTKGANLSFEECFKMEYRISQGCMRGKDFYEGVRAVIVDKDNNPHWDPPTIAEVSEQHVDAYFEPLPNDLEL